MKPQWLDGALLISPIKYSLCTSEEEHNLLFPKEEFLGPQHLAETRKVVVGDRFGIFVCLSPTTREEDIVTLVHEAVHVWQAIRDYLGEDEPATEQEAYCIETIFTNLLKEYDRQQAKPLKKKKRK